MSSRGAESYFTRKIRWVKTDDAEFPYETYEMFEVDARDGRVRIRVNDYPAEPLYTLMINGAPVVDLDDWPPSWERP